MIQIVETTSALYVCDDLEEIGDKIKLANALRYSISDDEDDDDEKHPNVLARKYVRAKLEGRLRTITLSTRTHESVHVNEELTAIIETLTKLIPLAEKRDRAERIMEEVDKLLQR